MPLPKYMCYLIKGKGKFEEKVPQTCEFCEHLSWRELERRRLCSFNSIRRLLGLSIIYHGAFACFNATTICRSKKLMVERVCSIL